ncbi:MAG: hypothetical protein ABSD68_01245 [Candidatus Micrarchaeales archaeon]|jgi:hypothetical protein
MVVKNSNSHAKKMVPIEGLKEWLNEGRENAKYWMDEAKPVALALAKESPSGEITEDSLLCELEVKLELTERHTWQVFDEMVAQKIISEIKPHVFKVISDEEKKKKDDASVLPLSKAQRVGA